MLREGYGERGSFVEGKETLTSLGLRCHRWRADSWWPESASLKGLLFLCTVPQLESMPENLISPFVRCCHK